MKTQAVVLSLIFFAVVVLLQASTKAQGIRKWTNIPYATLSDAQKLDIYTSDNDDVKFPVIVYIHGGPSFNSKENINTVFGFLDKHLKK
ncbi:MAG: hypothetical protein EHM64_09025 [Ignavibacteriae bacterium]|nr:MAG: hypothetical protein EHM64_09025 [Ignavibacteriota bacterium]